MRHAIASTYLCTHLKHLRCAKKAHLLWLKKLQGVQQITHLKQCFYLSKILQETFKDLTRKSYTFICYFIDSVVKIVLYLHFLYTKGNRLQQIKKKQKWWNNSFSEVFTYRLNLKHFASFFSDSRSNNFVLFFQP